MLFDSHAHLNDEQFSKDREEVIRRAREEAGVSRILNVGFNRDTIKDTLKLAETYDYIYAAVGWHPVDAVECTVEDLEWIESLTDHPKVVALGEMGLDYHWDKSPKGVQESVFRQQIRLARELGMPIIIHNREADEDVVRILREEKAEEVGGVMHCFGGDWKTAEACMELNFMIGLGGPVTFKNARLPKEIAKRVPLDRLLVETDCPYLAPHPNRGKRNESAYVRLVAEAIAELRDMPLEELARCTFDNATRLFRIREA
ncbi:TatD DNase family protein [Melghirimyces profundicolus]|uniref:TatD DNase family protein n=1 Tax=Melghirimyces profundicolus TaxID=1242148 RepID=A0A2T6BGP9_9BACL|nr:TatD family hydrolase [Melghirimyces profundicolus]PTX55226.1 TatD DNase family protein [Melghirimyces profundicolus]